MSQALGRFIKRQERLYDIALQELKDGKKEHPWMGFIFPQMRGLAKSRKSFVYGIINLDEAKAYLQHSLLGPRLIACCEALLMHKDKTAVQILGEPDAVKLRSSMTLFAVVSEENSVFHEVLEQFCEGRMDPLTLGLASGTFLDMTYRKYLVGVDFNKNERRLYYDIHMESSVRTKSDECRHERCSFCGSSNTGRSFLLL